MSAHDYMSVAEMAEIVKVTRHTILRHIRAGTIRAVKFGRQYRIPADELDRLLRTDTGSLDIGEIDRRRGESE